MSTSTDSLQVQNQVLLPVINYQDPHLNNDGSAPQISVTALSQDEDKLVDMIQQGQRGRMEDQRCQFTPSKSAPTTPRTDQRKPLPNLGMETESFLSVLASSQSRRLDDQRVFLPSLPGLANKKEESNSNSNPESNYLCYMVSKVQGSRMDDQRCSLPQITTLSPNGSDRARSASCTNADIYSPGKSPQDTNPAEEDGFYKMISQAQHRRMDDQRCELKPTPKPSRKQSMPEPLPNNSDGFFNQLAASQSRRLDDQRVSLPSLPGIQNGGQKMSASENEANYLCYMVSKAQGSRMDEQRCSAPFISQNMSPSFQRKDSNKDLQRSSSLNRSTSGKQEKQEITGVQEEQFLKIMKHAQKGRMEEQRCSLPISRPASPSHNGNAINNIAAGGKTDARSQAKQADKRVADSPKTAPLITVTQSTPTTSKKEFTRPLSMPPVEQASPRPFPKSASYGQEASPAQVTVRVSMSFSSLQGQMDLDQPSSFPELFLTLGAPGDNLMIPLSPMPGRRLSLSLNLIPKDEADTEETSNHPGPWNSHSGPPSPAVRVHSHSPPSPNVKAAKKGNKLKGKTKDKATHDKGKKAKKDKR
ncbi:unnamed protein product [Knipowitschia caucasica]|uniref:Uncharacterized protein n=1 Tax=Knipowitschia caucasica TaxID=637954 RepID=A0AAV2KGV3_KNICA